MKNGFLVQSISTLIFINLLTVHCQDATSILSGLLSTFATSSSSPDCSGECRHMLSALFCNYVDENANCGDPQLRCCAKPPPLPPQNRPSRPPSLLGDFNFTQTVNNERDRLPFAPAIVSSTATTPRTTTDAPKHQTLNLNTTVSSDYISYNVTNNFSDKIIVRPDRKPNNRPPVLGVGSSISVGTSLTVRPGGPRRRPGQRRRTSTTTPTTTIPTTTTTTTTTRSEELNGSQNFSWNDNKGSDKSSMQVPVAEALHGEDPSKSNPENGNKFNKPCNGICVSKMIASFCAEVSESSHCSPSEACCLIDNEPQEPVNQGTTTTSSSKHELETTTRPPPPPPTTSTTTQRTTTTTSMPLPRNPPGRQPEVEDAGVKECRGSCVMGLLSMLCDDIDRSVTCENGGQCCISKHDEEESNTQAPAATTMMTTTTPKLPPGPKNCPGICLPVLLSGVCNRPAVLIPDTKDCEAGKICCDNSLREVQTTTTTTSSPLLGLLSWPLKLAASGVLGGGDSSSGNSGSGGGADLASALLVPALAGLLSGSGSHKSPQTTTTTTTPSPQLAMHKNGPPLERPPFMGPFNGGSGGPGGPFNGNQPIYSRQPQQPPPQSQNNLKPAFDNDRISPPPQPMDQPTCTGTCIASFLKVTCFGASQVAEHLTCPKQNLVCCAPKLSVAPPPPPNFQSNVSPNSNNWNTSFSNQFFNGSPGVPNSFANSPPEKYVCGIKGPVRPETPRVVGGRDSSPGEWCWQIALINSLNQYLCGGALIGQQWVLTAAHCVTNLIRSGDAIYVRVGDYDLTSKYGSPGAQTLRVDTSYIHHNHNSQTLDNNIALLKLEKQVDLKEGVCLGCLPARGVSVEAGKTCVVTGYGYMGESGPIPLRIRSATLPIVSEQECVNKINSVTEKMFILPASSFCAGGEEGHDACQGDGGGPLSCAVDGYYEITGLVSWGFGCGRAEVPGIYVKVSSFIGWINQIISVNSV